MDHEPLDLERAGWEALSTSGEAAAAFYREHLADEVLMLLPGGLVIDNRRAAIDSMTGEPWGSYDLTEEREIDLADDSKVITYRVSARRGEVGYQALVSSTYVHTHEGWRLAVHQQTPV